MAAAQDRRADAAPGSAPLRLLLLLVVLVAGPAGRAEAYKWIHTGVDSLGDLPGQYNSLAIGSDGRLHGSYYVYDSFDYSARNLRYATNYSSQGNGPWFVTTVDPAASTGAFSSIALDSRNVPHIAYYNSETADLKHAWYDSLLAGWRTEFVDLAGTVGQYASIAVDGQGIVWIAYYDATTPGLKLARKPPGGLWTFRMIQSGVVGLYASINHSGTEVAYYDLVNRDLKYAKTGGAAWNVSTVDSVGDVGRYASIATRGTVTCIAYLDDTNKDLKFATKQGDGAWTISVIDATGDVGQSPALTIGPSERPAVLYYDMGNQDLKYAERFGSTFWARNVVASGGNVGRFNALRFDAADLPNALYYDETRGVLRYAYGRGEVGAVEENPPPKRARVEMRVTRNPAVPPASIELVMPEGAAVSLKIFDVGGRVVRDLFRGNIGPGAHSFAWDGFDDSGRRVSAGIYFASLDSPLGQISRRLVMVRS